jgi:uncharacterized protein YecT (DUF1311 family)
MGKLASIVLFLFLAQLTSPCRPATAGNQPKSWQEVCQQVATHPFPPKDRPPPDVATTLQDCSSYELYYGFLGNRNPGRARMCAYDEINRPEENSPFVGKAMLMTIYANGIGARRDLDLAIRLACEIDGAPAEMEGRVMHLAELRERNWQGEDFSLCDDITSGYMAGFCADHGEKFATQKRPKRLNAIQAGWSAADMEEFAILRTTADRYFQVHAENEVDQSGTARAALSIADTASQEEQFAGILELLEKRSLPPCSSSELRDADARLNDVYGKVQANRDLEGGTVTRGGIRNTQRMWLRYRDAWLKFCRKRYPACSADSIKCYLTQKRIKELEEFVN